LNLANIINEEQDIKRIKDLRTLIELRKKLKDQGFKVTKKIIINNYNTGESKVQEFNCRFPSHLDLKIMKDNNYTVQEMVDQHSAIRFLNKFTKFKKYLAENFKSEKAKYNGQLVDRQGIFSSAKKRAFTEFMNLKLITHNTIRSDIMFKYNIPHVLEKFLI
jgi:hypothetical protein